MSVNKVILVGRLGNDPEVKSVGQGSTMARLSIATNEVWMKDGVKQEKTEWHRVVFWGKQAELCGKHLSKGRQVYIEGKLQTRTWEDQGQKKYSTEIAGNVLQFLGAANERPAGASAHDDSQDHRQDFGPEPSFGQDDQIPF